MKRLIASLLTVMMLTASLVAPFAGGTTRVLAYSDGALTQRFAATGNYGIVAAGVGLDGGNQGDISLDVPGGNIVQAYLYWAGYDGKSKPDSLNSARLSVDGSSKSEKADAIDYGVSDWERGHYFTFVADVTSLVKTGDHDYTVSGNALKFDEPYGAGLMVVYEDGSLPVSYVSINDGLDSFCCTFKTAQESNSEVTYFDFASGTEKRSADVAMFVAGITPPDPEPEEPELGIRPNAVWYQTGDAAKPGNLIDADGTELAGGPPAPYPLGSSDGQLWDTYDDSVAVPAGNSWLGLQVESVSDGEGLCCHGLFVAAGMAIPAGESAYSVTTDKDDYSSGETVHVTGTGFTAGSELTIKVIRPDDSVVTGDGSFAPWPTAYDTVTTDKGGEFQYDYVLNGIDGEYLLQVLAGPWDEDPDTMLATTTFTDSGDIISATLTYDGTTYPPDELTVPPGATIEVSLTVTTTGHGEENDWESTGWQIGDGYGATSGCNNAPDYTSSGTYSETFNITAPSAPGTYDVRLWAYSNNNCHGEIASIMLADAATVQAPLTIASVTLDGGSSVTVAPGAEITAEVTVEITGGSSWGSTSWLIGGGYGGYTCVDTPDYTGEGSYTESFTITAPSETGTYDARFRAYANDGCGWGEYYVDTTLNSSVTVQSEPPVPNPELGDTCGLDIVLVMDESASIDATEFAQMQNAFEDFVNALLPSTPTEFALVDFGTQAYLRQGFTNDAATIIAAINGAKIGGPAQYTNWEQGLIYAHNLFPNRPDHPDLVIFASDGNPTAYGDPAQTDMSGITALPPAIAAANDIKEDGIRIITIGIGDDLDANNLIDISSAGAYYSSDFGQLAADLAAIASELCGGTITVHKVLDADGNLGTTGDQTTSGTAVQGWLFSLSVTGGSADPTSDTTDDTGTTGAFAIDIGGGSATVAVTETVKDGYVLLGAECTGAGDNGTFNPGTSSMEGIEIGYDDIVSVTFYNRPPAEAEVCDGQDNDFDGDVDEADLDCHTISFVSHTYDSGSDTSTWTYEVENGCTPAISHWVIEWCECEALVSVSESYECDDDNPDPTTGVTGIKFNEAYGDEETRTVSFTLSGDYDECCVEVGIKAGENVYLGETVGPCCYPEICDDDIDNDGDGLIDCLDPDCPCPECHECNPETYDCVPICAGTDEECGCEECVSCNDLDDWYNSGPPYIVQEGEQFCTYQPQEYRNYYCQDGECLYNIENTRDWPMGCTSCGECATLESQVIVSDTSTQLEGGGNAVAAWKPSAWNNIDYAFPGDAEWIWESYHVLHPVAGDVVVFEKAFSIPSDIVDGSIHGTIYITCDNGYEIELNGSVVGSAQLGAGWETSNLTESFVNSHGWETVEDWDISSLLTAGDNTLLIYGVNEYMGPLDGQDWGTETSNPGGLIFEIRISYCVPVEDGTPCNGDSYTDAPVRYCKEGEVNQVWEHTLEHYWVCENGGCVEKTRWINDHKVDDCEFCEKCDATLGQCVADPEKNDVQCKESTYDAVEYYCVQGDNGPEVWQRIKEHYWVCENGSCVEKERWSTDEKVDDCEFCEKCDATLGQCVADPEKNDVQCKESTYEEPEYYCVQGDNGPELWEHTLEHFWVCDNGSCVEDTRWTNGHLVEDCNDDDPCTIDSCDAENGQCVHTPKFGSISGFVWDDTDEDGTKGAGEVGIANVTIALLNATDRILVASTETDADGYYLFSDLEAGDYIVDVDQRDPDMPAGYCSTTYNDPADVSIITCEDHFIDFGYALFDEEESGNIGDLVWDDANGNGEYDAGEDGIPFVTLILRNEAGDTILETTETDFFGNYMFYNYPIGFYIVEIDLSDPDLAGYTPTTPTSVVAEIASCFMDADFGFMATTPPPPPSTTGGGGGGGGGACYLDVDMLGEITTVRVTCCSDEAVRTYVALDPDEVHFLELAAGTPIICGTEPGCYEFPEIIVMREAENPPPAPDGMQFVGPVYTFIGYKDKDWEDPDCPKCSMVTFGVDVPLFLSYDPELLYEGASSVVLAYYDVDLGMWISSPPVAGVVAEVGEASGMFSHFSTIGILAELPPEPEPPPPPTPAPPEPEPEPPAPAHFVASNLSVEPSYRTVGLGKLFTLMVIKGEDVTVTAKLGNDGGQEGSYVADLKINGNIRGTKEITLSPGQTQDVSFTFSDNALGDYEVQVEDLSGEFQSVVWVNWWLFGGLIAVLALLIWLGWYYGYRRRRR